MAPENEIDAANTDAPKSPVETKVEERKPQPAADPGTNRELNSPSAGEPELDIDFLLDIPLEVKVEVGRTRMLINDLLQLGQGSVVELTKLVGEPFEVLVNDKLIARGEVVVVNERFGIRLTDIISPMERIQQLA